MLHSRVRLAVAALCASAAVAGIVAIAVPAQATFVGIKCSGLTGNAMGSVQLTGCDGNTGGSSMTMPASSLANGGTVTWANGLTTTLGKPVIGTSETDASKDAVKGTCDPKTEVEISGTVTADTTGSAPVPGRYKAEVCVDSANNLSLEKGTKDKIS